MIQETLKQKQLNLDEAHSLLYHIGYSLEEIIDITNEQYNLNQSKEPYYLLIMVIKIYNDGWYPNLTKNNEERYSFKMESNGDLTYWSNDSKYLMYIPSALCLKSIEIAKLCSENHTDLIKKVYK